MPVELSGAVVVLMNFVAQFGLLVDALGPGNTDGRGRWGDGLAIVASGLKPAGKVKENPHVSSPLKSKSLTAHWLQT